MTIHADIEFVRSFLSRELEQRENGGDKRYVRAARRALEAFENVASWVGEEDRRKQLADFDEVWPGGKGEG